MFERLCQHSGYKCLAPMAMVFSVGMGLSQTSMAGVALSDNFSSAVQEDDVVVNNVTTKHIKSVATWYGMNQNAGGSSATIGTDNYSPLNGNALYFANYSSNSTMVAGFSSVTLAKPGDWIQLSMNYRYTTTPTGTSSAILGLYNDSGTPVTQNHLGERNEISNDVGYQAVKSATSGTDDLTLKKLVGGNNYYYITAGTQLGSATSTDVAPSSLLLTSVYTLTLKITLADNGADLLMDIIYSAPGGVTVNSTQQVLTSANVVTKTFNEVGISFSGNAYADNIEVTTNVPEPASLSVIACGALLLLARRLY